MSFFQNERGVPVLSKQELEEIALDQTKAFVRYDGKDDERFSVWKFAAYYLGKKVRFEWLSNSAYILGMSVFTDHSMIPIYNPEDDKFTLNDIDKNTILLDKTLGQEPIVSLSKPRFTLMHECAHQLLHQDYFKRLAASGKERILRNELTKGDVLFQKTYNVDPLTKKRAKNKGELPMYYLECSHPGIIDRETWECVRLELERQKAYCRDHHITVYYQHSEENPLSGRIICSICGSTFMLLRSKRVGDTDRAYWRCSSFRGERGLPIEGRTFTPPPRPLTSKVPDSSQRRYYRGKKRKLPEPRQMLCTDIHVPAEEADKAFMRAWNFLVSHGLRYTASYREMARDGKDELIRYRAREMARLLDRGRIRETDYGLMLRTLDHIEVTPVGRLAVIFLTGTRVTVQNIQRLEFDVVNNNW